MGNKHCPFFKKIPLSPPFAKGEFSCLTPDFFPPLKKGGEGGFKELRKIQKPIPSPLKPPFSKKKVMLHLNFAQTIGSPRFSKDLFYLH
jgi:hypothetical protein